MTPQGRCPRTRTLILLHLAGHCRYWEADEDSPVEKGSKVPYRVEIVGVTCDPGLAVARGIWRQVPNPKP